MLNLLYYLVSCAVRLSVILVVPVSDARRLKRIPERPPCDHKAFCISPYYVDNLPTLHTRPLQDITTTLYKVKNDVALTYIVDFFVIKNSQYSLRNSEFVLTRFRIVASNKRSI